MHCTAHIHIFVSVSPKFLVLNKKVTFFISLRIKNAVFNGLFWFRIKNVKNVF